MNEVRLLKTDQQMVKAPLEVILSEENDAYIKYLCEKEIAWCKERNISVVYKMKQDSSMKITEYKRTTGNYEITWQPPYCIFIFKHAADALLFRLTWA